MILQPDPPGEMHSRVFLVILEAIISSSKIASMSHGCVLHLFVSWMLGKTQGTREEKDAFSDGLQ